MNKESFLEELRGYLRVLEDQEQEDILEEYAQHIDMKLQKGLSEEEAIKDFGSMKELAAEILEAYHVKPEFPSKGIVVRLPGWKRDKGEKAAGGRKFSRIVNFLKGKVMAVPHSIKKGLQWLWGRCRVLDGWLKRPWGGRKAGEDGTGEMEEFDMGEMDIKEINTEEMERQQTASGNTAGQSIMGQKQEKDGKNMLSVKRGRSIGQGIGRFFRMTGRGIAALWSWLLRFCVWWVCLLWNAVWLSVSLFFAAMAMVALAGLGIMAVLLFQGYPLFGFSFIGLGCILCFGALACGAFSLRLKKYPWRKGTEQVAAEQVVAELE